MKFLYSYNHRVVGGVGVWNNNFFRILVGKQSFKVSSKNIRRMILVFMLQFIGNILFWIVFLEM